MRRALFYAPMNPPEEAKPSGDRAAAGLLARALEKAGYAVESASALRSYEAEGNAAQHNRIEAAAKIEAERLIAAHRAAPPALFLTYMNYHKAPDHIGPVVSAALGIPYVIVEASHAPKRATGPFAAPHAAATRAIQAADAVFAMTGHDARELARIVAPERLHRLEPFIDTAPYEGLKRAGNRTPVILTAAMLRPGKKLENFPLIAAALARLADLDWHYLVAGDGPGRDAAMAPFAAFPKERVTFAGAFPREAMPRLYARGDLYLWPGLKEGYGIAYLEAQAAGLPVVACDTAGVPAVVSQGRGGLLSPPGDAEGLAQNLRILLSNRMTRETMGEVAREAVLTERGLAHGAARLGAVLKALSP